jgi:hypothetical protein
MAVIYLRHEVHGVKVATMDLEAEADIENGWERFDPNDDDSVRSDLRSPETAGRPRRRRNALVGNGERRADSVESDDRLVGHGTSGGLFNTRSSI